MHYTYLYLRTCLECMQYNAFTMFLPSTDTGTDMQILSECPWPRSYETLITGFLRKFSLCSVERELQMGSTGNSATQTHSVVKIEARYDSGLDQYGRSGVGKKWTHWDMYWSQQNLLNDHDIEKKGKRRLKHCAQILAVGYIALPSNKIRKVRGPPGKSRGWMRKSRFPF